MTDRRKKIRKTALVALGALALIAIVITLGVQGRQRNAERWVQVKAAQKDQENRDSWVSMIESADEGLAKEMVPQRRVTFYLMKAYAHAQLREWEPMRDNLRTAREADETKYVQGMHLASTAEVLAANAMYDEAITLFEDTLKSKHASHGINYARFLAFTKREDLRDEKRATTLFRAGLAADEESYTVHADLSKVLANTEQWEDALLHAKKARDGAFRHQAEMQQREQKALEQAREKGQPTRHHEQNLKALENRGPKVQAQWNGFVTNCEKKTKPGYSQKY